MPKRKRTYNVRLIKRYRSYTIQEVAGIFGLHPNAVGRWVKNGLPLIDNQRPGLIHSDDLIEYLNARQAKRKKPCKPTEAHCCKCRQPRPFWEGIVDLAVRTPRLLNISGLCAVCSCPMFKGGSTQKIEEYRKTFIVQTVSGEHLIQRSHPPVMCDLEQGT